MLFSQIVTAIQLRDKLRDFLLKVTGQNVLQIVHRGQPIRVIMTQEKYLTSNRSVKLTSRKQYQVHYDFDPESGAVVTVSVFK